MNLVERRRFLKKCINSSLLPSHEQLANMNIDVLESDDKDYLRIAYTENCDILTIEKENYLKEMGSILGGVQHCYKEIFLSSVSEKASENLKHMKRKYIQEIENIQINAANGKVPNISRSQNLPEQKYSRKQGQLSSRNASFNDNRNLTSSSKFGNKCNALDGRSDLKL